MTTPPTLGKTTPRVPTAAEVRTALTIFKFAAIAAGLAMFVLIAEMILKYGLQNDALTWWSPIHGMIFMVFVVSVANLGMKLRWSMGKMAKIIVGACIPFVAFIIERRTAEEVEALTLH